MPLRISVHESYTADGTSRLVISTNVLLHKRGQDWHVYKNTWDGRMFSFQADDHPLLQEMISALMSDDAGVSLISVENYSLEVLYSSVFTCDEIVSRIMAAARRQGHNPVLVITNTA